MPMSRLLDFSCGAAVGDAARAGRRRPGAYEKPYDPYPWCAVYGGMMGGASNCGFLTIEQCRLTVSGIGGSCEPNQFYNPRRPAAHRRKKPHD